jgi:hypothetical protein
MSVTKRVAIVQSSYIPWKGYFDLVHSVDEFILLDEVQYTRRDWRNRNRIKTATGPMWLTVPVATTGQYLEPINRIAIADAGWASRHWRTIATSYARAPYFERYAAALEDLYLGCRASLLSLVNHRFLTAISDWLGIRTKISWSSDYEVVPGRTERLVSLCRQAGARVYVTGPSAAAYLDERLFEDANVKVMYFDYSGYPEYGQLYPPFEHRVSVVDLLLNQGPEARRYMLTF